MNGFDLNLLMHIHDLTHNNVFNIIMPYISTAGNNGIVWIVLSLLLLINRKYRYVGILCIAALLLTAISGEGIIKNIIQRPRPFNVIPNVQLLIAKPHSWSFPSGHTASSFTAFWVIFRELKAFAAPVFIMAAAIAFSRMYLLVHYPSDIAGGIILGIICAELVIRMYYRLNKGKRVES
ncbi:MAG: phosphatase PAP2 family protein [Solirubrobacterales bacterium]